MKRNGWYRNKNVEDVLVMTKKMVGLETIRNESDNTPVTYCFYIRKDSICSVQICLEYWHTSKLKLQYTNDVVFNHNIDEQFVFFFSILVLNLN